MFDLKTTLGKESSFMGADLTASNFAGEVRTTHFDLAVHVMPTAEQFRINFVYSTDLFDAATIKRMLAHYERLLEGVAADPECRLSRLPLLSDAERHQLLVEWNDTAVDYPHECVHELFEAQAARTPDAVAVVFEGRRLSYGELNARANRLAHHLIALGVGPEVLVGICVERSAEMVIGLLAILKAGGAYVPLDPKWPPDRVRLVVEDARLAAIVTQKDYTDQLPPAVPRVVIEPRSESDEAQAENNPERPLSPADPAYVLYTSGTTGVPKGVLIEHRHLVQYVWAVADRLDLEAQGNYAMVQPLTVDSCLTMIFPALGRGGTLHLISEERALDATKLAEYFGQHRIDYLKIAPSHLAALLDQLASVALLPARTLIIGGEASHWEFIDRLWSLAPPCTVWNHYGPTECTVGVSVCKLDAATSRVAMTVPIGRPLANVRYYILDQNLQPVPSGLPGELYIGGEQLARGYLNRPELTAEKFVADPFAAVARARLYRTGDLARYLPDGNIEYLGRLDEQVKIRGFRIEPGEIEAVLCEHPAVRQAVVQAREDTPGDKRLVAYVVVADAALNDVEPLRALLRERLPDYMCPAAIVLLKELPLTAHGKVDRKALPAPDQQAYATTAYEAPVGETETALAEIWADVLQLEKVGRHDNFFELGGHSLLAVSVIERMRRAGLHVDVRTLFTTASLAQLAAEVGNASSEVEIPPNRIPPGCEAITPEMLTLVKLTPEEIERVLTAVPGGAANVQDIYPLAPLQEGIFFHHMLAHEGDPYLMSAMFAFDSRDRLDGYVQALQAVVDRHDILRTAVLWEGLSEPVQVVWRRASLVVEEINLDAADNDVAGQLSARFDRRQYRLDVRQAPLMRLFVAHDAANARWVMLKLSHHLSTDHVTLEVLQQEIQAHLRGESAQLPAPVPYRNFVAQARLGVSGEEHEAFFREMLGDVDEPTTPFGLDDVRGDGSAIMEARQKLDASLSRRLRARTRVLGMSTASLCHLAWAQVLARLTGRDDVVFGTVLLGRMQAGEGADRAPGLFLNTLPVRIHLDEEGAQEAVRHTHMQLAQLLRHEHASLALAQRCSALPAPMPLFSSLLNYLHSSSAGHMLEKGSEATKSWPGIEFLRREARTNYPLLMSVADFGDGFALHAQVQSPIDPQRVCTYMLTALERLVDALENAPATPLSSLDVMPQAERHRLLVEWNDTATDYPRDQCIHQLFQAQAARTPEAVAVVFEDQQLTYAELNARANQLAHHLIDLGVGPETPVGVCLERSPHLIVALLAILKAGGAYLPSCWPMPGRWCCSRKRRCSGNCRLMRAISCTWIATGM
jgi:amino acid adenylation domain-containing protein